MKRYTTKIPQLAFGAAAAALTAVSFSLLVLAPAGRAVDGHPDAAWTGTGTTAATLATAGTVSVIHVVGVRPAHRIAVTDAAPAPDSRG